MPTADTVAVRPNGSPNVLQEKPCPRATRIWESLSGGRLAGRQGSGRLGGARRRATNVSPDACARGFAELSTWLDTRCPRAWRNGRKSTGADCLMTRSRSLNRLRSAEVPPRSTAELFSSAAIPTLVDLSKDAELLVTGSRGSGGWPGRILGSVSSALLRHAHCPVAIIHDEDLLMPYPVQAPVLVGVDGSSASELATAIAFDEASRRNVGLIALHAWSDVDVSEWPGVDWPATQSMAEQVLAERLAGWQEQYPDVNVRRIVVRDQPARQLVERSEEAQLLVVGSRAAADSPKCWWVRSAKPLPSWRGCRSSWHASRARKSIAQVGQGNGADHRSNVPPVGGVSTVNVPPTCCAR